MWCSAVTSLTTSCLQLPLQGSKGKEEPINCDYKATVYVDDGALSILALGSGPKM